MPRLIVTRPQREAQRWVCDLAAQGLEAIALPLIEIGPPGQADAELLRQAWAHLADYAAVMFVSANAADYFFASNRPVSPVFSALSAIKTRAWGVGPGTARALLRAGVEPGWLDVPSLASAQFDSEALWLLVKQQVTPGQRVLVVRGSDASGSQSAGAGVGREWLAERVRQAGGRVDFVVAYQRSAPKFGPLDEATARQAAVDGSVWLFSSSEAIAHLLTRLPGQSWGAARALATHPRIAQAAKEAGFGRVDPTRPTLADVVAALKTTL
jgi:uroporphyrinogen-III synthase